MTHRISRQDISMVQCSCVSYRRGVQLPSPPFLPVKDFPVAEPSAGTEAVLNVPHAFCHPNLSPHTCPLQRCVSPLEGGRAPSTRIDPVFPPFPRPTMVPHMFQARFRQKVAGTEHRDRASLTTPGCGRRSRRICARDLRFPLWPSLGFS